MSQICLYLDEDAMKQALLEALQNSGIDAIAVTHAHKLADSDEEQLIWSAEQGRVIYTYNVGDFCRLHRNFMEQGRNHAGIAIAHQQRYSVGTELRGLLRLIDTLSAEDMRNKLVFLSAYIIAAN